MPSTHLSLHYPFVFSTKNREPWLAPSSRKRVHEYVAGRLWRVHVRSAGFGGSPGVCAPSGRASSCKDISRGIHGHVASRQVGIRRTVSVVSGNAAPFGPFSRPSRAHPSDTRDVCVTQVRWFPVATLPPPPANISAPSGSPCGVPMLAPEVECPLRPTLKNLVTLPGRRSGPIGCVSRLPVILQ